MCQAIDILYIEKQKKITTRVMLRVMLTMGPLSAISELDRKPWISSMVLPEKLTSIVCRYSMETDWLQCCKVISGKE